MRHKLVSVAGYPAVRSRYSSHWFGIILNMEEIKTGVKRWKGKHCNYIATCLIILDRQGVKVKNRIIKQINISWLNPIPNLDEKVYKSWLNLNENGK